MRPLLLAPLALLLAGSVTIAAIAWHSEIAPISPPSRESFAPALIARGAELAAVGNCAACHTLPGAMSYAGGFPVETPFGTVFGTNITPDADTGIGSWSLAAFARALHSGIDRAGRHLYPAFPYDHYTLLRDEDVEALYAFMMTRQPVHAESPANRILIPRFLVAGWNLLFLDEGRFVPDRTADAMLQRGAYLAEGLGHCGACHTPRNWLGAEKRGQAYAGGEGEGWRGPALNAASPAPVPWDPVSLTAYLRDGIEPHHGVAAGPMAPIVRDLATVGEADVQALAAYIASRQGPPSAERRRRAEQLIAAAGDGTAKSGAGSDGTDDGGAAIFAAACSTCHGDGVRSVAGFPPLTLSSTLNDVEPRNLLHILTEGIHPPEGAAGPQMPGFDGSFTEAQLVTLLDHLRTQFTDKPAWSDRRDAVAKIARNGP